MQQVSLSERELPLVDGLASIGQLRASVDGLCVPGVISVAMQPVIRLADLAVVGYEALARMPVRPHHAPDWWLERAGELGMRPRLEIACWRAISSYGPPPGDVLLFVNVSPAVLAEPDLLDLRDQLPEHLVIEVTEQEAVADYMRLRADLRPWLNQKARLAIDDTGSGHSSMRHVIELSPDFLKIDRSLVTSVDTDRNRRALVRSLVAFAREVGSTVIAEGVETRAELDTLRDADVDLVQGFLFGLPRRPWGLGSRSGRGTDTRSVTWSVPSGETISFEQETDQSQLAARLAGTQNATAACEAVVDYLYRRGDLMPSIYLARGDLLRCVARRGLWQVLDGMSPSAGITGRTWAAGRPTVVADVTSSPDYLEAIPGVVAEICVPIICDGRSIGSLNVESLRRLPGDTLQLLTECARLLSERLLVCGWSEAESGWQRAARASVALSSATLEQHATEPLLAAVADAAAIDSAALIERVNGELVMRVARGPLAEVLRAVPQVELELLSSLVDDVSSCYTGGETTGRGFLGTESLRAYARAVAVLPLWAGGNRLGTLVLASSKPRGLTGRDVEPLELLARQLAATLSATSLITQLRRQAREDRLTGLGNRAAFEEFLDARRSDPCGPLAAVILDIDHFKSVNDRLGHLAGDQVLCTMSAHLAKRLSDTQLFRYGGDEFALLLEGEAAGHAEAVAGSLCRAAGELLGPYGSSITAGLATGAGARGLRELFAEADEALLWAKQHARGTAVQAGVRR